MMVTAGAERPALSPVCGINGKGSARPGSVSGLASYTTWSFLPIFSMRSRTKSSCSSVWVAM